MGLLGQDLGSGFMIWGPGARVWSSGAIEPRFRALGPRLGRFGAKIGGLEPRLWGPEPRFGSLTKIKDSGIKIWGLWGQGGAFFATIRGLRATIAGSGVKILSSGGRSHGPVKPA